MNGHLDASYHLPFVIDKRCFVNHGYGIQKVLQINNAPENEQNTVAAELLSIFIAIQLN